MKWKEDLKKFESNNYSGSAELLEQYIELILYWMEKGDMQSPKDRVFLMDHSRRLQETHQSLFVLVHFCSQVTLLLTHEKEEWRPPLLDFLSEYKAVWSDVSEKLATQAISIIDMSQKLILCHSQSSAVKEVFQQYSGNRKKVKVIQTESRPVFEGRMQAEMIKRLGYDITLVPDVGFARHLDKINMILLGADSIYKDYFVNKAGTYNICLAGKNAGIPIYVLADSRKFWSSLPAARQEMEYNEHQKAHSEIWQDPPSGIGIENFYFEKTPSAWVDGFITEIEVIKPSRVENMKPLL
jgi:translation initiation factor 2B subunit (eIF-2B alpha/beta/delta family)